MILAKDALTVIGVALTTIFVVGVLPISPWYVNLGLFAAGVSGLFIAVLRENA